MSGDEPPEGCDEDTYSESDVTCYFRVSHHSKPRCRFETCGIRRGVFILASGKHQSCHLILSISSFRNVDHQRYSNKPAATVSPSLRMTTRCPTSSGTLFASLMTT